MGAAETAFLARETTVEGSRWVCCTIILLDDMEVLELRDGAEPRVEAGVAGAGDTAGNASLKKKKTQTL